MGWEGSCLLDVRVAGPGAPWCPLDRLLACFAASPLPVPSFLVRPLLGRVPGGGVEMGWRVPPITLAVKRPASWNAGMGVRCYQGPKEER